MPSRFTGSAGQLRDHRKDGIADDPGLAAKPIEIEPAGPRGRRNTLGRGMRNDTKTRLRPGQRDLGLDAALEIGFEAEDRAHLGRHEAGARKGRIHKRKRGHVGGP